MNSILLVSPRKMNNQLNPIVIHKAAAPLALEIIKSAGNIESVPCLQINRRFELTLRHLLDQVFPGIKNTAWHRNCYIKARDE